MPIPVIREVSADVVKRGSTRALYAKQNDLNSRFLDVRIQEDGKDLVIAQDRTVILNVERSDREKASFYGEVNEGGTVRVPLTAWMLELEGTLVCDVSVVSTDDTDIAKLTTMSFNIYVEAAVITDEAIVETENYSVIVDLLTRTEVASERAIEAAKAADEAGFITSIRIEEV